MALEDKRVVRLTPEERAGLERMTSTGRQSAAALPRARILLEADADGPDARTDDRIPAALDCSPATVARVRTSFANGGIGAAVGRERPAG